MLALLVIMLTACDTDCEDASRINGTYATWHTVLNSSDVDKSEGYPSYQMFFNGWSKWDITWQSSGGGLQADITDVAELQGDMNTLGEPATQTFSGKLTSADDNCNVFVMDLEGNFETTVGTNHTFVYHSDLVFMGDHLSGTFTYDDSYTGADDTSGEIANVKGEVSGTMQDDTFDTGFIEN